MDGFIDSKQGKHSKVFTIVENEDVKISCLRYLRSMKPEQITSEIFASWLTDYLKREQYIKPDAQFNDRTARRWLHKLNYRMYFTSKICITMELMLWNIERSLFGGL